MISGIYEEKSLGSEDAGRNSRAFDCSVDPSLSN